MFDGGTTVQVGWPGVNLDVGERATPTFLDWNNDGLADLIVGQGNYANPGMVRIYLNVGTQTSPQFSDFSYAQSNGADLSVPAAGCLGSFPRAVYWDADDRKDLLVG